MSLNEQTEAADILEAVPERNQLEPKDLGQDGLREKVEQVTQEQVTEQSVPPQPDIEAPAEQPKPAASQEKKKEASLDWELSEEHQQMGMVALVAMAVFLLVMVVMKPGGKNSSSDSDDPPAQQPIQQPLPAPPVYEPPPKPQPVIVDFTAGQRYMVLGASLSQSGSMVTSLVEGVKKYGMMFMPFMYMFGGPISAFLATFGAMNIAMVVCAFMLLAIIRASWPRGPEGDTVSDILTFILRRIIFVLLILATLAVASFGLYRMVPPKAWAMGNELLDAYMPNVRHFFNVLAARGHAVLPFLG